MHKNVCLCPCSHSDDKGNRDRLTHLTTKGAGDKAGGMSKPARREQAQKVLGALTTFLLESYQAPRPARRKQSEKLALSVLAKAPTTREEAPGALTSLLQELQCQVDQLEGYVDKGDAARHAALREEGVQLLSSSCVLQYCGVWRGS